MKITSSLEYGMRLMAAIAKEDGGAPLSAEKLSREENIPLDYTNQILWKLKSAGVISSRRGSGGGYSLARPPHEITMDRVVIALEGSIFEDVCSKYADAPRECHHQSGCSLSPLWRRLGALLTEFFSSTTLEDLIRREPATARVEFIPPGRPLPMR